jgi:hypothetical protein
MASHPIVVITENFHINVDRPLSKIVNLIKMYKKYQKKIQNLSKRFLVLRLLELFHYAQLKNKCK